MIAKIPTKNLCQVRLASTWEDNVVRFFGLKFIYSLFPYEI